MHVGIVGILLIIASQQLALENKTLYDQLNFKLDEHREKHQACTDLDWLLHFVKLTEDRTKRRQLARHAREFNELKIPLIHESAFVNKRRNNIEKKEKVELADAIFNLSSRVTGDQKKISQN